MKTHRKLVAFYSSSHEEYIVQFFEVNDTAVQWELAGSRFYKQFAAIKSDPTFLESLSESAHENDAQAFCDMFCFTVKFNNGKLDNKRMLSVLIKAAGKHQVELGITAIDMLEVCD